MKITVLRINLTVFIILSMVSARPMVSVVLIPLYLQYVIYKLNMRNGGMKVYEVPGACLAGTLNHSISDLMATGIPSGCTNERLTNFQRVIICQSSLSSRSGAAVVGIIPLKCFEEYSRFAFVKARKCVDADTVGVLDEMVRFMIAESGHGTVFKYQAQQPSEWVETTLTKYGFECGPSTGKSEGCEMTLIVP